MSERPSAQLEDALPPDIDDVCRIAAEWTQRWRGNVVETGFAEISHHDPNDDVPSFHVLVVRISVACSANADGRYAA